MSSSYFNADNLGSMFNEGMRNLSGLTSILGSINPLAAPPFPDTEWGFFPFQLFFYKYFFLGNVI